jgi:NAD(P)-dependent dehydrogenase (short-subunit alcohol dehydrogenase family)
VKTTDTDVARGYAIETLRGRVALVTGGTRGIGAAISRRLAANGACVAAGYWHGSEAAEKLQASDGIGLTVNAVTPGFIATDMLATIPEKVLDRIRGQIPVGRLGSPEEIARVVAFLAADESAYITGQIWAVNGGLDM